MLQLKIEQWPLSIQAYRLADIKTAEFAEWDLDLPPVELGSLQSAGFDLELIGFDAGECQ